MILRPSCHIRNTHIMWRLYFPSSYIRWFIRISWTRVNWNGSFRSICLLLLICKFNYIYDYIPVKFNIFFIWHGFNSHTRAIYSVKPSDLITMVSMVSDAMNRYRTIIWYYVQTYLDSIYLYCTDILFHWYICIFN